jgi:hypothetical protein
MNKILIVLVVLTVAISGVAFFATEAIADDDPPCGGAGQPTCPDYCSVNPTDPICNCEEGSSCP